jgi:hypothetical protein
VITVFRRPWWLAGGITATPIAAWQAKGAASYAASQANLVGGTAAITGEWGTVGWDAAYGWYYNGGGVLFTNIYPYADASMSAFCRFSNGGYTTNQALFGASQNKTPYNAFQVQVSLTSGNHQYANDGLMSVAGRITGGVLGVSGRQGYKDGVADGDAFSDITNQGMPTGSTIYIGMINLAGSGAQPLYGRMQAIVFYNGTVTADQAKALYVEMARL